MPPLTLTHRPTATGSNRNPRWEDLSKLWGWGARLDTTCVSFYKEIYHDEDERVTHSIITTVNATQRIKSQRCRTKKINIFFAAGPSEPQVTIGITGVAEVIGANNRTL